jgi:hypothetical protein
MIVVLVGIGAAKGDTISGTSDSIHFHTRRTGVSDITTGQSHLPRYRAPRQHTRHDADLDLDTLPTARVVALPGGEDWPLGNKGPSLDVTFGEHGDESTRNSGATALEKARWSEDQRAREYRPQTAGGSSSAVGAAV